MTFKRPPNLRLTCDQGDTTAIGYPHSVIATDASFAICLLRSVALIDAA